MNHRDSKLTALARGMPCTLHIEMVCCHNPETTVWAHSNFSEHGKGKSIKADDAIGCFACATCHMWLDQGPATRDEKRLAFYRAMTQTYVLLWTRGLIRVSTPSEQREARYDVLPKILSRRGM